MCLWLPTKKQQLFRKKVCELALITACNSNALIRLWLACGHGDAIDIPVVSWSWFGGVSHSFNDKTLSPWDGSTSIPKHIQNYGFKILSRRICLLACGSNFGSRWLSVVTCASFTYSKHIRSSKLWKGRLLKCICHRIFSAFKKNNGQVRSTIHFTQWHMNKGGPIGGWMGYRNLFHPPPDFCDRLGPFWLVWILG